MKKLSSLLLALAGSLACSGANGVPSPLSSPGNWIPAWNNPSPRLPILYAP